LVSNLGKAILEAILDIMNSSRAPLPHIAADASVINLKLRSTACECHRNLKIPFSVGTFKIIVFSSLSEIITVSGGSISVIECQLIRSIYSSALNST